MPKKLKSIPKFKNEDEERDFWDKADITDYFNLKDFKRVSFPNLKMSSFWFITWNVPEYKEWAQKKRYGYLLTIIRNQKKDFLVAKAKLIFKPQGLPEFVMLKSKTTKTEKEARRLVKTWQGVLTAL